MSLSPSSFRSVSVTLGSVEELTATMPVFDDVFWIKVVPEDGTEIEVVLGEVFTSEPGA